MPPPPHSPRRGAASLSACRTATSSPEAGGGGPAEEIWKTPQNSNSRKFTERQTPAGAAGARPFPSDTVREKLRFPPSAGASRCAAAQRPRSLTTWRQPPHTHTRGCQRGEQRPGDPPPPPALPLHSPRRRRDGGEGRSGAARGRSRPTHGPSAPAGSGSSPRGHGRRALLLQQHRSSSPAPAWWKASSPERGAGRPAAGEEEGEEEEEETAAFPRPSGVPTVLLHRGIGYLPSPPSKEALGVLLSIFFVQE